MNKYSFRFRKIWVDAINSLNEESRLCLYTAICKYALDGQTPDFSDLPTENAIFSLIKEQIDDGNDSHAEINCDQPGKVNVYGSKGVCELFGTTESTALKYMRTFLKPAITKVGKFSVVDVEMAKELFIQHCDDIGRDPRPICKRTIYK